MRGFTILLFLPLVGCATQPISQLPNHTESSNLALVGTDSQLSLFSSDASVLSDAEIERILAYEYQPPESARIAILPLGREAWFGYSDELSRAAESVRVKFITEIENVNSVIHAEYLPTLLIPTNRSVAHFREAAARFQVDLMVIYQASCQTYQKFRFFSANTSKSFCSVEAVILDVRTGIVPFSASATQEFEVEQTDKDINIHETRRKAELRSIQASLIEIGKDLAGYLNAR